VTMEVEDDPEMEIPAWWRQDVLPWSFEVFGSKTSVEEEIIFEDEDESEEADCRQVESQKKRVPIDPPKESTARYMTISGDTNRVSINPPAAKAVVEHQEDPGEESQVNVDIDDDEEDSLADEVEEADVEGKGAPRHNDADVAVKGNDDDDEANDLLVEETQEMHEDLGSGLAEQDEVGSLEETNEKSVVVVNGDSDEPEDEVAVDSDAKDFVANDLVDEVEER